MNAQNLVKETPLAVVWTMQPEGLTERQILNRLHKLADAERRKKAAEKEMETLRAEILQGADSLDIDADAFAVKYQAVTSSRIDTKRLKAERPDIYAEYTTQTTANRFTYKIR